MKVGILGAGNISDTHARAALGIAGVEIAAVCGTNRDKAERMLPSTAARPTMI